MKKHIPPEWTGDVVKELHLMAVTKNEFADYMGISRPYVSEILCGRRINKKAEKDFKEAVSKMRKEYEEGKRQFTSQNSGRPCNKEKSNANAIS